MEKHTDTEWSALMQRPQPTQHKERQEMNVNDLNGKRTFDPSNQVVVDLHIRHPGSSDRPNSYP